jgi:hypothetical protein
LSKEDRFRIHTISVWQRGHDAYIALSETTQQVARRALDGLVAALRCCASEEELHACYWKPGDWATEPLQQYLPDRASPEFQLDLEDAAFWLRLQELRHG